MQTEKENGFEGELELDESYFEGKHHKSKKCSRGFRKTNPHFWYFKKNGKVYAQIIPNSSLETLLKDCSK